MGQINKGTIASISNNTARVVPSDARARPTAKIVIPWHLRGDTGNLKKGTEVVYVEFDDSTGLLLGRADGEWGSYLPNLSVNTMDASKGVTAETVSATGKVSAGSVQSSGSVSAQSVTASGEVSAGSVNTNGQVVAGSVQASGNVSAKNVTASGEVTAETVKASGDVLAGEVSLKNHTHDSGGDDSGGGESEGGGSEGEDSGSEGTGGGTSGGGEGTGDSTGDALTAYSAGSHQLTHNCTSTGDSVSYWLHVPEGAKTNMPVLVFLHGAGERNNIAAIKDYGPIIPAKEIYGDAYPFIAVYPSLKYESWYSNDFPATIKSLIQEVVSNCSANSGKIIITGHSLGAIGTWDIVSRYGAFFSCAVPVSCPIDGGVTDYANLAKVPIWAFCGDGAVDIAYLNSMKTNVETVNSNGGNAKFSTISNCDHGATKEKAYTESTFDWMLAQ